MVAFNFRREFKPKILNGTKLSTIRSTQRCNVGDIMQLYVGQRTAECEKLMDARCVGVCSIVINHTNFWATSGIFGNVRPSDRPLHEQEGFQNVKEMVDFFREQYGLPYTGYLHAWQPVEK